MNPKVVVIGAGASGIAAATQLVNSGFSNVIVLEAEHRIGGRIFTVPFSANSIDIGAQWCHGEKNNVVYEYVSRESKDLLESSAERYSSFHCIRSNKQVVPKDITRRLHNIILEHLHNGKDSLDLINNSLGVYLTNKYFESLRKDENADINEIVAKEFFEFYKKFENSIEASDNLSEVSGKGYLQYWECEGDPLLNWKESGYITYLKLLLKTSETQNYGILEKNIILKKLVTEINYTSNKDGKLIIKCSDGQNIEADHVICTMSLGVLKENYKTLFKPKLSAININAIEGLSFGTVNKIFIEFAKPIWPKDWPGFSILWDVNDLQEIRKRRDNWIEDVFGFYTVDHQPNILCGWISGVNGRKMELDSENDVLQSCVFLFNRFLTWDIPKDLKIMRSTWHKNANFRGSYSFRSIQTELMNTNASDLATPIVNESGKPMIQFAGEATHSHYYSTVHGAIESGWREANCLIDFYSKDENYCDVLILGSGLAGLGAGYALRKSNMNYKILEAQDYIGGRLLTAPMKDYQLNELSGSENIVDSMNVEVGAQWLHGKDNPLYEIALKNDLIASEFSAEGLGSYIRDDGYVFDELFVKKIDFIVGEILKRCESFGNCRDFPSSLGRFLRDNFLEYSEKLDSPNDRQKALQLLDWHKRFQMIDNSCLTLNDLSAKWWGQYSFNGEECQAHINLRKGSSSLIDAIVEEIDGTKRILLNHEVTTVNWNSLETDKKFIQVQSTNNKVFYAKHVIVTFSIGVLHTLATKIFRPLLPDKIQTAIEVLGFATINKIFLQFKTAWWGDLKGIQIIYSDDCLHDKHNWTRSLSGFDVVKPGPPNTLIGWVGSSGAIEMEQLSDEQIVNDCIKILKTFTKSPVPNPTKYYCSRWGSNKYIRGGYSFISTKADENSIERKLLADPLRICYPVDGGGCKISEKSEKNVKSLSFAGEAYHDRCFATAHGAFMSGMEQAEKILKFSENICS